MVANIRHSRLVGGTVATIHAHEDHSSRGLFVDRVRVRSALDAGAGTRDGFVEEPRIQFEFCPNDIRRRGVKGGAGRSAVGARVRGAPKRRAADVEVLLDFVERIHAFRCGTAKVVAESIAQRETLGWFIIAGIEGPGARTWFRHDSRHVDSFFFFLGDVVL